MYIYTCAMYTLLKQLWDPQIEYSCYTATYIYTQNPNTVAWFQSEDYHLLTFAGI